MKPSDFKYFKANSLDHALDILNSEENIKIIAGGQSLVPLMNFRLGQPDILLDINDIKDLNFVFKAFSKPIISFNLKFLEKLNLRINCVIFS